MSKFLPGRHPIDGFGNGGFRFANMSHLGSLLIVPSGMQALNVDDVQHLTMPLLKAMQAEQGEIDFILIGTGALMQRPPAAVMAGLGKLAMQVDFMNTNAAVRTYNVILAEGRRVAAILIAVDNAA